MDHAIKSNTRTIQMDLLRIVASIMVIVMHVVGEGAYTTDVHTFHSSVFTFYSNLCRSAVPIFFIFSGMYSRSTDWKKSIRKALKYFLIFIAFTAVYRTGDIFASHYVYRSDTRPCLEVFFKEFTQYKYHLWYLREYVSLILWAPVINCVVKNDRTMLNYLTAMFLVGTAGVATLNVTLGSNSYIRQIIGFTLSVVPENIAWGPSMPDNGYFPSIKLSYVGYYIFGRFMHENWEWFRKRRRMLYVFGVMSMVFVYVWTRQISIADNQYNEKYYNFLSLPIFFEAVMWIVLFDHFSISEKWNGVINWLSKQTLWIYLVHVLVIDLMTWCGFRAQSIHPVLGVPLKTAFVFAGSCGICGVKTLVENGIRKIWTRRR